MKDTHVKVVQFITLSIALGILSSTGQAQSQGSWTTKAPIPLARNEVASIRV